MATNANTHSSDAMNDDTQRSAHVPIAPKRSKRDGLGSIASTVLILLLAPLFALFLTAYVFQSYQVDGPSMQTTLFNNDHLVVWKVSRTWARLTGHPYVPGRGDIVIFGDREGLAAGGQDPNKQLVKRVIGLPGDRVVIKNGTVTIYNKQHPDGFQPDKTLAYGKNIPATYDDRDEVVPAGSVYVLGDNRGDSYDSRFFGSVPANNIVGKLVMRVWPLGQTKRF